MGFPERLKLAEKALRDTEDALSRRGTLLSTDLQNYLQTLVQNRKQISKWVDAHRVRESGMAILRQLDQNVDVNDQVSYQGVCMGFPDARLLLTQAYLAATWSLADRVTILLTRLYGLEELSRNPMEQTRLMTNFFHIKRKTVEGGETNSGAKVGGLSTFLLKHSFGWPMALSYVARNIFLHEGGHIEGKPFFDSNRVVEGFKVSPDAMKTLESRSEKYCHFAHNRVADPWPWYQDDFRELLHRCHTELDQALGFLLVAGCEGLKVQVGLLLEDL